MHEANHVLQNNQSIARVLDSASEIVNFAYILYADEIDAHGGDGETDDNVQ